MVIYWFLFLVPVYFLLGKSQGGKNTSNFQWLLFSIFLTILIGLRDYIGADWFTYSLNLEEENELKLDKLFFAKDPGFTIINWISLSLGAGIYGINLICAFIFTLGLINLSRAQPYPWLAVLVSIPYLVIVVAMGYTRQAAAMGCLMYAFGYLIRGRIVVYLLLIFIAGMIHKTALIFAALALFKPGYGKLIQLLGVILLFGLSGGAYLFEQTDKLILNYVDNNMESSGGQVRVFMNLPPALILFLYWKKWRQNYDDFWLWGILSIIAIALIPLVTMASTAIDRMALYLIPLQIVIWARFPSFMQGKINYKSIFIIIIIYYAIVQFIWLVYAHHASAWVPYNNILFNLFRFVWESISQVIILG